MNEKEYRRLERIWGALNRFGVILLAVLAGVITGGIISWALFTAPLTQ